MFILSKALRLLTLLALLLVSSSVASFANNVLDAPAWDVLGVSSAQMISKPESLSNPIEAEAGVLPSRWPNTGSLLPVYKKGAKKDDQRQMETPNLPQITPMPAAPAGI